LITLERRRQTSFPAGKKRFVLVNRLAIVANMRDRKNYPTVIVVEDGLQHEFHECNVSGTLQYADHPDVPAKVFVETEGEIVAFVDTQAEQTFLQLPSPKPFYVRWWERFMYGLGYIPLVSCFVGLWERPEQPKPVRKPTPVQGCG